MSRASRLLLLFGGGPSIVTDGLLVEYRFDDGSGQILTDYRNGYDLQLGSTDGADTNDPSWVSTGQSFTTDDYNKHTATPVALKPAAWTVMGLFSKTGTTATALMAWDDNVTNPCFYATLTGANQKPIFYMGANNHRYATPASALDDGTWWVITGTMPGSGQNDIDNVTCYQNKTALSLAAATKSGAQAAKSEFRIGASSSYLTGSIGFQLLYNRVLTEAEIFQNYEYIKVAVAGRGISLP